MLAPGWAEALGYIASLLVAASLMMSNVKHLRWVNLAGALAFTAYGAWVHAWPVFAVNLFVAGVDVYYLDRMARQRDFFTLMPIETGSAFVTRFLRYHRKDLGHFFPTLPDVDRLAHLPGFFVLRNMLPVGIFLYESAPDGAVVIRVDYVIPEYRDRKNADFVFRILNEQFSREGKRAFVCDAPVKAHRVYLQREGFEPDPTAPNRWQRPII